MSDILFMIVGIGLLILSASGNLEMGPFGYIAAIACIGFGVARMARMRKAKAALKSDLLQDPRVMEFYRNTQSAWTEGKLSNLTNKFEKEGRIAYEPFVKRYRPIEGTGLHTLFSKFPPLKDEYMVGVGDSESGSDKGWFVLTNKRLIQKDGRDKVYKEIDLAKIDTYDMSGKWTKKMDFKLTSGETVDFEKVEMFPAKKYLDEMIRIAKGG